MSGDVRTLDDSALERIASGEGTMRDDRTLVRELAAEVLRLRGRLYATGRARDDAGDAFDVLVRRVWEAATGDTHEGPASVDVLLEAVAGLRARADAAHLLAVRVVQATELHDDLAAVDATPESAIGMVRELRAELTFSRGERGAVEDLARRMEARALRAEARAEKAEAAHDALRVAVREWFDAEAAAEEAADVAEHACGMAGDLTRDALDKANVRRAAARTRLRALAGEG